MWTAEQALLALHTFGEAATGITALIAAIGTITNRLALSANHRQTVANGAAVAALRIEIDGRIGELLRTTAENANALGQIAGRAAQRSDEAGELATANRVEAERVAHLPKT